MDVACVSTMPLVIGCLFSHEAYFQANDYDISCVLYAVSFAGFSLCNDLCSLVNSGARVVRAGDVNISGTSVS